MHNVNKKPFKQIYQPHLSRACFVNILASILLEPRTIP